MKRMLVTGGAGFIGSEFVRQAVGSYDVAVIDCLTYAGDVERLSTVKSDIRFYQADITDPEKTRHIINTERPDILVHWAAESHVDRSILNASPFIDTNIKGTQVLLDCARAVGLSLFVNISTDEVYGDLDEKGQFTETTCLNPSSPYSVSKAAQDMLGRAYHRTHKLPVITLRPSNNYGYWQYPEKLLPVIIFKAYNNERIPIYGKGENVREWLHVSDCARAVLEVIEKGKTGEVYNIGSGNEERNIDVVKTVLKIMNKPESLIEFVPDRPGHDFRYSLNCSKIKEEINWSPTVDFQKGLYETTSWYLSNLQWVEGKLAALRQYWDKVYRP